MSVAGDGLLTPEPRIPEAVRRRAVAQRQMDKRIRGVAGILWLLFGILMVFGALAVSWGLQLKAPFLMAVGLVAMALWCGVTAIMIVRYR